MSVSMFYPLFHYCRPSIIIFFLAIPVFYITQSNLFMFLGIIIISKLLVFNHFERSICNATKWIFIIIIIVLIWFIIINLIIISIVVVIIIILIIIVILIIVIIIFIIYTIVLIFIIDLILVVVFLITTTLRLKLSLF